MIKMAFSSEDMVKLLNGLTAVKLASWPMLADRINGWFVDELDY